MAIIVKGTTPTIIYKFKTIDVNTVTTAIYTIKKDDTIVLRKTLTDATIKGNALTWTLTQEETLSLDGNGLTGMLNWKVGDERGVSKPMEIIIANNHIEEVI